MFLNMAFVSQLRGKVDVFKNLNQLLKSLALRMLHLILLLVDVIF